MKTWKIIYTIATFIFVACMLFFMAHAEQQQVSNLGTFKQFSCVNLIQTCGNCTFVNISSVLNPNSTLVLTESAMTKLGTQYNKTFCTTSITGTYVVNGHGNINGVDEVWAYTFEVTPTGGNENATVVFIILILISSGLLLFSFIFRNYIFAIISGMAIMFTGAYVMANGIAGITTMFTKGSAVILIGLGAIIFLVSAYEYAWGDGDEESSEYFSSGEDED